MSVSRPFYVRLRRNSDGEERDCYDAYGRGDEDGEWQFLWAEGNLGCDCNRSLVFYNGGPESEDRKCGHEAFDIVRITDAETGAVICEGEPDC